MSVSDVYFPLFFFNLFSVPPLLLLFFPPAQAFGQMSLHLQNDTTTADSIPDKGFNFQKGWKSLNFSVKKQTHIGSDFGGEENQDQHLSVLSKNCINNAKQIPAISTHSKQFFVPDSLLRISMCFWHAHINSATKMLFHLLQKYCFSIRERDHMALNIRPI